VLVSGGGVHHPGLMASLAELLAPIPIHRFDSVYFDGDAKEAVAFALLGYLTLHGQPGNLPAATGARGARVLGSITPP
jgi:anhydro-N-acetylmuramic acid kinase